MWLLDEKQLLQSVWNILVKDSGFSLAWLCGTRCGTETGGRVSGTSGAAAKLGIPPSTLDSKIKSLKIDKYRFKTA
jgi:hypothetical protein